MTRGKVDLLPLLLLLLLLTGTSHYFTPRGADRRLTPALVGASRHPAMS